jgi:hypothetical protein
MSDAASLETTHGARTVQENLVIAHPNGQGGPEAARKGYTYLTYKCSRVKIR